MDLDEIKKKLYLRLEFSDSNDEETYQEQINEVRNKYPDEGWRIPEGYTNEITNINNNKLRKIRTNLNDDDGFNELYKELNNLKANKERKEQKLRQLIPPNKPNLRQQLYSYISRSENSANNEIKNFENNALMLQNEINNLNRIIIDLEKLKPIYDETKTNGGKRKSRRNEKNKKSKKNHRKIKSSSKFVQRKI